MKLDHTSYLAPFSGFLIRFVFWGVFESSLVAREVFVVVVNDVVICRGDLGGGVGFGVDSEI